MFKGELYVSIFSNVVLDNNNNNNNNNNNRLLYAGYPYTYSRDKLCP